MSVHVKKKQFLALKSYLVKSSNNSHLHIKSNLVAMSNMELAFIFLYQNVDLISDGFLMLHFLSLI